jgi:hypothetical protein
MNHWVFIVVIMIIIEWEEFFFIIGYGKLWDTRFEARKRWIDSNLIVSERTLVTGVVVII